MRLIKESLLIGFLLTNELNMCIVKLPFLRIYFLSCTLISNLVQMGNSRVTGDEIINYASYRSELLNLEKEKKKKKKKT